MVTAILVHSGSDQNGIAEPQAEKFVHQSTSRWAADHSNEERLIYDVPPCWCCGHNDLLSIYATQVEEK